MNLEKRAIDQLAALPQPITVKGGGYAYTANVKKNPYKWMASDGSPITLTNIKELGEYLAKYIQEDWDAFVDDQMDAQDLVDYGIIRVGQEGAYRDQEDFEHKEMLGDAVGTEAPHTIVWSMGHNYKQVMRNAVKELGLQVDSQGYEGGSTLWSIVFYNDKKLTPDQWDDLLRDNVGEQLGMGNSYPNWMEVESADDMFESKQIEESKPLDKEVYNVNVKQIKDDIFGGFHTQYRVRIPKGQGDPKELVIAALKKHGIPEPFEIVGLHKGMFNRKDRAEHKLPADQDVDKHWLLNNSGEKTVTEETDIERLLKLAGMYHKPQVFETEENKEGDQSPLSDVTDFVADIRGEKAKNPEKFVNADGDKSVLSEKDVEEGWDPYQDELEDEDYYDDQSQEDFPGRSRRFANPGSALYAADSRNPRIHACPTCGGENRLTQRDLDAGYQCDRCADAAEGIGMGSYAEGIEEGEVDEDYLEPPHQKDPHTNEEDDWYDPEDARRQMARMGAHPEFTGRHELKPHDPVADQAAEDEWIMNQNAEQEQMAAMDDWDVFNKQGVDEEGDLSNGYGDNHAVDGEDFFPSGATSNVARKVGPAGARHGDNPMSKVMATESKKLHEKYLRDFADFKKKTEVTEARPPATQAPRSGMSVGREVYDLLWKNKMFVFDRDDIEEFKDTYSIDLEFSYQDIDTPMPSFEQWLYKYHLDIRVSGAAGGAKYINVQLLHMAPYLKDWKKAKELIERNIGPVLQIGSGGYHDAIRVRFDRSVLNA